MSPPVPHHCETCLRPLAWHSRGEWIHEPEFASDGSVAVPDHRPAPIPDVESPDTPIDYRCDFCSASNPPWKYRCGSFVAITVGDTDHGSSTDWAACDTCADLIDGRRWSDLADHVFTSDTPMGRRLSRDPALRTAARQLWRQFRANYTPGRQPI